MLPHTCALQLAHHDQFEHYGVKKLVRSTSGVLVITVLTSPFPEGGTLAAGRWGDPSVDPTG